jgi:hypothetical protein
MRKFAFGARLAVAYRKKITGTALLITDLEALGEENNDVCLHSVGWFCIYIQIIQHGLTILKFWFSQNSRPIHKQFNLFYQMDADFHQALNVCLLGQWPLS